MKSTLSQPSGKIAALLADDQEIFLTGLSRSVRNFSFINKVCCAQNYDEVITLFNNLNFNIIFLNIGMKGIKNSAVSEIIKKFSPVKIIGFASSATALQVLSFMDAGGHGFFLKNSTRAEIRHAIIAVMNGEIFFSKSAQELINATSNDRFFTTGKLSVLKSERMKKILLLICRELTIKEIADQMNLSEKAVEKCRSELMKATGARNAVGLALFAVKNGLLEAVGFEGEKL